MLSRGRRHLAALLWLFACVAAPGCTPIRDVSPLDAADKAMSSGSHASNTPDSGALPAISVGNSKADSGSSCPREGERTCDAGERARPLLCSGGQWMPQAPCAQDERCETASGASSGTCVAIASECIAHSNGEDYCDGDSLRSCVDMQPGKLRSCGDRRRCATDRETGQAQCWCAGGAIDQGMGCQVATNCTVGQGGCDPLTMCSVSAGQRICSACPPGYTGDGVSGCVPQLLDLTVGSGVLSPAFDPGVHSYHVQLGLTQQALALSPVAPPGAKTEVDGMTTQDGSTWHSSVLTTGAHTMRVSLVTSFGKHSVYELTVERTGIQEAYVKASRPDKDDQFGWSAAIDADTLVVSALEEASNASGVNGNQVDNSLTKCGAAYVFVRSASGWTQQAYLKSDTPEAYDYFGWSVAVAGDTVAVGAPGASPTGVTPAHSGSVHIFTRENGAWRKSMRLDPPSGGNVQDMFGASVSLQAKRLVVGSPMESSAQEYSGTVYVYARDGESFGAPQKLKASKPAASGLFGWMVALDGDSVAVGAPQLDAIRPPRNGPGSAFVFALQGDSWVEQPLSPTPAPEVQATFGWSIGLSGDTALVGAPRARASNDSTPSGEAYVFERSGGTWKQTKLLRAEVSRRSDFFGYYVSVGPSMLAVGAPGDASDSRGPQGDPSRDQAPYSGALYVYGRQGGDWVRSAFLKAANGDGGDGFASVIAGSGDTLVSAAMYESSASQGVNGDPNSNSLPHSGAVYIFR